MSELLVALGGLRASAHACVVVLADTVDPSIYGALDGLWTALSGSGSVRIRGADHAEAERELELLCKAASEVVHALSEHRCADPETMLILRRFEASVRIAQTVLAVAGGAEPASGVHKASTRPPASPSKTGT
jgi:hypothetical protein